MCKCYPALAGGTHCNWLIIWFTCLGGALMDTRAHLFGGILSTLVCVYICIYVCMYVCMYSWMYTCVCSKGCIIIYPWLFLSSSSSSSSLSSSLSSLITILLIMWRSNHRYQNWWFVYISLYLLSVRSRWAMEFGSLVLYMDVCQFNHTCTFCAWTTC